MALQATSGVWLFPYPPTIAANNIVTKYKRIIVIDDPPEFSTAGAYHLEYRVTSAVGWRSRGGEYVIQLQDHFLPWRVP